mmetsp:Transcript_121275/g.302661  ORF Transcript_121275/g.302661 Transcript_121275/m.302661 type:complete len:255 (-) Transcript_121275:289-1053(-)
MASWHSPFSRLFSSSTNFFFSSSVLKLFIRSSSTAVCNFASSSSRFRRKFSCSICLFVSSSFPFFSSSTLRQRRVSRSTAFDTKACSNSRLRQLISSSISSLFIFSFSKCLLMWVFSRSRFRRWFSNSASSLFLFSLSTALNTRVSSSSRLRRLLSSRTASLGAGISRVEKWRFTSCSAMRRKASRSECLTPPSNTPAWVAAAVVWACAFAAAPAVALESVSLNASISRSWPNTRSSSAILSNLSGEKRPPRSV